MSALADSMPRERELIAGALRPVEYQLTNDDDWFSGDPVAIATDAVLPVVVDLIAEAEKRGAAKALRTEAYRLDAGYTVGVLRTVEADHMRSRADAIESGEVAP
jgi:hypothetical protein